MRSTNPRARRDNRTTAWGSGSHAGVTRLAGPAGGLSAGCAPPASRQSLRSIRRRTP
jgi:hypothetical protein